MYDVSSSLHRYVGLFSTVLQTAIEYIMNKNKQTHLMK